VLRPEQEARCAAAAPGEGKYMARYPVRARPGAGLPSRVCHQRQLRGRRSWRRSASLGRCRLQDSNTYDLYSVGDSGLGGESIVCLPVIIRTGFVLSPHSEQEVPVNVPVLLFNFFSTDPHENVVPLDDPGRVISQTISVVLYKCSRFRYSGLILSAI
jgi:hypothetical protein